MTVHVTLALIFFFAVMVFKWVNNKSIIDIILKVAGYTYGPLLGLFAFGIMTKRVVQQGYGVLIVSLAAPIACYILSDYSAKWFEGYQIGLELLLINGMLTFLGLLIISKKPAPVN